MYAYVFVCRYDTPTNIKRINSYIYKAGSDESIYAAQLWDPFVCQLVPDYI